MSEKRQSANREGETMRATSATKLDECPMTADPLILERVATPTGPMRIVSDQEGNLCGLDWEDCAPRLQELLRRVSEPIRGTQYFLPLGSTGAMGA